MNCGFFGYRDTLFTPGCFRSCFSDQAGSISETHLLWPLSTWIKDMCPYHPAKKFSVNRNNNVSKLSYHKMCNCGKSKMTFHGCFHIQFYSLDAFTTSWFLLYMIFKLKFQYVYPLPFLLPSLFHNADPPYSLWNTNCYCVNRTEMSPMSMPN